jgi:CIC family chloride channel protein
VIQKLVQWFFKLPRQSRQIVQICLYGSVAAFVTVFFQLTMSAFYQYGIVELSHASRLKFLLGSLSIVLISSMLVGLLLNSVAPEAKGSGVPQLKVSFWKDFGYIPFRVAWVKFLAGILSIGGGASLGREGPSVQIAGAVASNLAGITGEPKQNQRTASAAGAAAGLAAAFNTPLAAVTFVLEEIIGDLNSRILGSVLLASVLGALIVHGIVGRQPAFSLTDVDAPSWRAYALAPLVAFLASCVGVYFQKTSLRLRNRVKKSRKYSRWIYPVIGAGLTWIIGASVFELTGHLGVFGLGYDDLSNALKGALGWKLALLLLFTKFLGTFLCYGFEGCGGIFSPTLFLGGMTGVACAKVFGLELTMMPSDVLTLGVLGMSACLGAVVWAPVTGILIVFEMTHEFSLVPILMIGGLISQAVGRKLNHHNFYDTIISDDGHKIEHAKPPRDLRSWQNLPAIAIANTEPVILSGLSAESIQTILNDHPYERFPLVENGKIQGIILRNEMKLSFQEKRKPRIEGASICSSSSLIKDIQSHLVDSNHNMVILCNETGGIHGIVTLHDLLRAEISFSKQDI